MNIRAYRGAIAGQYEPARFEDSINTQHSSTHKIVQRIEGVTPASLSCEMGDITSYLMMAPSYSLGAQKRRVAVRKHRRKCKEDDLS